VMGSSRDTAWRLFRVIVPAIFTISGGARDRPG
jgi:hypothetical protein